MPRPKPWISSRPKCCAYNCDSASSQTNIRFYCLPQGVANRERRQQWIKNIGRKDLRQSAYVCEKHFAEDQFDRFRADDRKILWNAVPTIFTHNLVTEDSNDLEVGVGIELKMYDELVETQEAYVEVRRDILDEENELKRILLDTRAESLANHEMRCKESEERLKKLLELDEEIEQLDLLPGNPEMQYTGCPSEK